MPAYEFDYKLNAFVKTCAKCKTNFVGAENNDDTIEILSKNFHTNMRQPDGLQPICIKCLLECSRKYNGIIGTHDYDEMLKQQNGSCKICKTKLFFGTKVYSQMACVDHDRFTGKVRGILCQRCNKSIGAFEHDVELLAEAIIYLERTK